MTTLLYSLLTLILSLAAYLILTKPKPKADCQILTLRSPNQITSVDIWSLVLQAILKHLPGYSPALIAGSNEDQTFQLPAVRTEGLLRISEENIASFIRAVNPQPQEPTSEAHGGTINPFFLPAQTVPLIITILANRSCPIRPLGAVNTRNVFHFLNPALCRNATALKAAAAAGELSYGARFGGEARSGRRRKRGVEFCVAIEVFTSTEVILRQECYFLQFLPKNVLPKWGGQEQPKPEAVTDQNDAINSKMSLSSEDPIRWAATSKDYNPIHVSRIGAKLFGFQNVIAHGNHVGALAVQNLWADANSSSSEAYRICWQSDRPFSIELDFTRPFILPATADIQWQTQRDGSEQPRVGLKVTRGDKLCLEGSVVSK
ncbi:hypothetical protein CB0940_12182 [Cercospora beticola]|uniref:MaoC-like domain-containing protein n=1 Tax=Cercospora beticola TaxID=122368 RepID=A0A2G5GQ86_CERBT|nr:hypothetical protein CB0940_12182 [Cercospora beticola]PIA82430.1 hypothetical protein CB0940_12182 [Cercospora beticola]WPB03922.1 hypothetical protein RHO25_008566 [Cercospora beticola]